MYPDERHYCEHDDDISVDSVEIDGDEVLVITIDRAKIDEWHDEGLDRAIIHVEMESRDSKFF